eukprot:2970870-Rhodomonas_salina.2
MALLSSMHTSTIPQMAPLCSLRCGSVSINSIVLLLKAPENGKRVKLESKPAPSSSHTSVLRSADSSELMHVNPCSTCSDSERIRSILGRVRSISGRLRSVSYTHLRAHETEADL